MRDPNLASGAEEENTEASDDTLHKKEVEASEDRHPTQIRGEEKVQIHILKGMQSLIITLLISMRLDNQRPAHQGELV
jgi:hypothetical protein